MAGSAPTDRVVDIVELLSRPGHEALRFSDVVAQLALTQATAHAILATLCERGWVSRDPTTKTYSLGPALAAVGARADLTRPLVHAARAVMQRLHDETGYASSILERLSASLIVAAHVSADDSTPALGPGDRIPYTPPFGVALAAWDAPDGRQAWLRRGGNAPELVERLEAVLTKARGRGFDIDWTTPAMAQAAELVVRLQRDGVPAQVADIMDRLLVECTAVGLLPDDDPARRNQPVATIAAPVLDEHGFAALILAIHPLKPLSAREIRSLGVRVNNLAAELSDRPVRTSTSSPRARGSRRTPA
ncbi:helix-turn-helix domain-containing protein [Mycobacterium sp. 236(2023)]|uniref:IclR family transcriptional regulator n=1 Tax=Mycobacterium sp. 236(2023) TaxID=3038163 RepID=UPI0024152EB3|nr:helix-turn-helix domain-containing protein [Mycobacterium sp. 236(2023)]MDG4668599.1 helix-turn-helix domain-containing protein [Mycobacterium sp. 236(2023)]